jgi:RimJ/RimL family protein N-acetyltransferase
MIHELVRKDYPRVLELFKDSMSNPVIHGVIEGNNPGKIFVDNKKIPQKALIWAHTEEDFFLIGDAYDKRFITDLRKFISKKIPNIAKKNSEESFSLAIFNDDWKEKIDDILADIDYSTYNYLQFKLNRKKFEKIGNWIEAIPADCELKKIDSTIFTQVEDEGGRKFQKWWYSFTKFQEKGVGYVLIKNNKIVSTCIACFGGANAVEIGIVTDPDHLRKGYAFLTAAAFIEECLNRGINPIWSTSEKNTPSQKLAEKLGFELANTTTKYYFVYDEFYNQYEKAMNLAYDLADYKRALEAFEKARKIRTPDGFFYYHYACTLALMGERDEAFTKLYLFLSTLKNKQLQHKDFILSNQNLANLKEDIRWQEFIEAFEKMEKQISKIK